MQITFKLIEHNTPEWLKSLELREIVLRKSIGAAFSEAEKLEEQDYYQIAGYEGHKLVAAAVMKKEESKLKMQRVAVEQAYRNKGIGAKLLSFCENIAHNGGYDSIYCHARDTAVKFYRMNGYHEDGEAFIEDGIPHQKMTKPLYS